MARENSFEERRWAAESLSRHAFWPTVSFGQIFERLRDMLATLVYDLRVFPTLHL
jgi:hypothetical protein